MSRASASDPEESSYSSDDESVDEYDVSDSGSGNSTQKIHQGWGAGEAKLRRFVSFNTTKPKEKSEYKQGRNRKAESGSDESYAESLGSVSTEDARQEGNRRGKETADNPLSGVVTDIVTRLTHEHKKIQDHLWQKNVNTIRRKRRSKAKVNNKIHSSIKLKEAGHRNSVNQFDSDEFETEVSVSHLPPVEHMKLPKYSSWVYTPRNFVLAEEEEEEVTNIPYFSESAFKKKESLVENLSDDFIQRLVQRGIDRKLYHGFFYDLVTQLVEAIGCANNGKSIANETCSSSAGSLAAPSEDIFKTINQVYPEFGSTEYLRERYKRELGRMQPSEGEPSLVPNIDQDNVYTEGVSSEDALASYVSLYCRRCFVYNCLNHGDTHFFTSPEYIEKKGDSLVQKEPCGLHCYMHSVSDAEPKTRKAIKRSQESKDKIPKLTPGNETMFKLLNETFVGNFCVISKMMGKRCEQVHKFGTANGCQPLSVDSSDDEEEEAAETLPSKGQRTGLVWGPLSRQQLLETVKVVYQPCYHPGIECSQADDICSCKETNTACEKFCTCPEDCKHRFVGCRCEGNCDSNSCPCLASFRECDPDLCSTCGAAEHGVPAEDMKCNNVSIQMMKRKHLKWAKSDVPNGGWGIFAGEAIARGEFISEYVGELVSDYEADRRGIEYHVRSHTYLFELNSEFTVDAERKGSKIRFANHASNANVVARVMKVFCDHRIGVYAARDIEAGEEIFLTYKKVLDEHVNEDEGKPRGEKRQMSKVGRNVVPTSPRGSSRAGSSRFQRGCGRRPSKIGRIESKGPETSMGSNLPGPSGVRCGRPRGFKLQRVNYRPSENHRGHGRKSSSESDDLDDC